LEGLNFWNYIEPDFRSHRNADEHSSIMNLISTASKNIEDSEEAKQDSQNFLGQGLQEQFEIIEKIGSGGMSHVYKARQRLMNRYVALKVCRSPAKSCDKISQSFSREVQLISAVTHENIGYALMASHDQKTDRMYYAMEFIDGPSVEEMLAMNGKFSESAALQCADAVAQALECLHSSKIVHLDVKPSNLITTSAGVLKLVDFGLARRIDAILPRTERLKIEGTPLYMAPEQSGLIPDAMDGRTDLYALGCTLFHMLTGHPPYYGKTSSGVIRAHVRDVVPRVESQNESVSFATADLICSLMQRRKFDRIASATELRERIRLIGEKSVIRETVKVKLLRKPFRFRRR